MIQRASDPLKISMVLLKVTRPLNFSTSSLFCFSFARKCRKNIKSENRLQSQEQSVARDSSEICNHQTKVDMLNVMFLVKYLLSTETLSLTLLPNFILWHGDYYLDTLLQAETRRKKRDCPSCKMEISSSTATRLIHFLSHHPQKPSSEMQIILQQFSHTIYECWEYICSVPAKK